MNYRDYTRAVVNRPFSTAEGALRFMKIAPPAEPVHRLGNILSLALLSFDEQTGEGPSENLSIFLWNAGYRPNTTTVNHAITAAAVANDYFWLNWFIEHKSINIDNCAFVTRASNGLFGNEYGADLARDYGRVKKDVARALRAQGVSTEAIKSCAAGQARDYDAEQFYIDVILTSAADWERNN